jgi:hypothetical protein
MRPAPHGVALAQHAWPSPPHAMHVPPPPPSLWPWQASPLWQLPPPQQACPAAPQDEHVPAPKPPPGLSQPRPVLHIENPQQGWPDAPQAMHMKPASAAMQPSEPTHVPWQHACPACPHAVHVPPAQLAPCAVQNVAAPKPPSAAAPQQD